VQRLNDLLDEESKKTAPYSCLLYAASTQIYIIITKLALSSQDAGIISDSARFFHILIDGEVEGVLDSRIFARSLVDLVKRNIGTKVITLGDLEEGDLVELLFGITTKIRLDPEILPAWFYPATRQEETVQNGVKATEFAGATRRTDFPLFYLLVDYVYHDGRTGDFARTGLLYLTDTASKSSQLEKWMIESDLATLMASGLGALYSRLSRRLPSMGIAEELPPILALSELRSDSSGMANTNQTFRHDLNAFLSYLLFWQDTLNHCQSVEVKDTLLDHFQVLFLQQLLYPSLLESSDVNGGTSASVITYLYQILESLEHPELVRRILEYLLASKDQTMTRTKARKHRMSLSRRKSFDALTALADARDNPSPDLFNLMDLIIMSLKSKHTQTVAASLKLVTVIQQRHHRFARTSLIHTRTDDSHQQLRKLPELNAELQLLMSLAPIVSNDRLIDQSYSEILKDVLDSLETHNCSSRTREEETLDNGHEQHMTIVDGDPLLTQLTFLLASFFGNDTMTNLALTGAIISIASCPLVSFDGWLLSSPNQTTQSTIMSTLEGLIEQVRQWKSQIPQWDSLIAHQKNTLNDQNVEFNDTGSASVRSRRSLDSHSPSSLPRSPLHSIEIPNQTGPYRGRRPPRTLHSEGFRSIDGSLSSSPVPPNSPLQKHAQIGSPLRPSLLSNQLPGSPSSPTTTTSCSASNTPDPLHTRLPLPSLSSISPDASTKPTLPDCLSQNHPAFTRRESGTQTPSEQGGAAEDDSDPMTTTTLSLSHILVNAIILQEFVLEVAAVVQVRACLLGEVEV
jgi:Retinoic acid induced 16-like protein/Family of unknown function (DUF5917)